MGLSEFIVFNIDRIVDEWEQFAETITPAAETMNSVALRFIPLERMAELGYAEWIPQVK